MKKSLYITFISVLLGLSACRQNLSNSSEEESMEKSEKGVEQLLQGLTLSNQVLAPLAYVAWMRDPENGLYKSKQIDEVNYSLQYKTEDYINCIESESPEKVIDKRKEASNEFVHFFDFKMHIDDMNGELLKYKLNSAADYNNRVQYMAFGIEKDIFLLEGNDTLPCTICHFERAYDVAPEATVLVGFISKQKYLKNKTFIFHDKLFNNGIIKFTFSANEVSKIPLMNPTI